MKSKDKIKKNSLDSKSKQEFFERDKKHYKSFKKGYKRKYKKL